jgi:hypothetical protein
VKTSQPATPDERLPVAHAGHDELRLNAGLAAPAPEGTLGLQIHVLAEERRLESLVETPHEDVCPRHVRQQGRRDDLADREG